MQLHNQAALLVWGLKAEQQNTHFDGKHANGRCGVPTAKPTKKEQHQIQQPQKKNTKARESNNSSPKRGKQRTPRETAHFVGSPVKPSCAALQRSQQQSWG